MPRPSSNVDRRLLEAARALVPQTGFSGLKVRELARRAGVNLGMFHYHFKTKDAFARRLLQELYEDFFARLALESSGPGAPLARLGRALTVVARFGRENRHLVMVLIREVMQGQPAFTRFARQNVPRHAAVIAGLIAQGQRAGHIKPVPLPLAVAFAMGGVGVPNAVVSMLERVGATRPFGTSMKELESLMLSDRAFEQRIDLILSGLATERGRGSLR